ncbi:MAG: hypothetical protein M3082_13875 [Candidatus Dormibacteraeota bacterium]|nr:hypothetical protein [Candidatus Dormibacteraeota bacterium]
MDRYGAGLDDRLGFRNVLGLGVLGVLRQNLLGRAGRLVGRLCSRFCGRLPGG